MKYGNMIVLMHLLSLSVRFSKQAESDVGWDKPQKNFSVAIFDPVMVSGSPSFSNNVTWLKVKGLENTWDRSSSDRNVFSITMMINMIIGNFFRQE